MLNDNISPADNRRAGSVHIGNLILAIFLATLGCTLDLWTKHWAFSSLGMPAHGNIHWIIDGFFGFETSINTGALFGIGKGGVAIFAAISGLATLGIFIWLTIGGASRDRWLSVTLGLILGGVLGNLYDRMGLWGHQGVRDFILFRYKSFTWPNFNIADMLLICGAAMMMWHAFRMDAADRQEKKAAELLADDGQVAAHLEEANRVSNTA